MGRIRNPGPVAEKATSIIQKMKKPIGRLTIGTKMLNKRRLSLIIKSDTKLQQMFSVQIERDEKLDARNDLEYLRFRRHVKERPTRPRPKIYKKKIRKTVQKVMPVSDIASSRDPNRSDLENSSNSPLPETKVSRQLLMRLIVPIIIKIEDCPEAEEKVREMQEKQVELSSVSMFTSDPVEDHVSSGAVDPRPGVSANSQFPVSQLFKDAAEAIRNALNSQLI